MTIEFPEAVDAFVNPKGSDALHTVSHSGQHTDTNDSVREIEQFLLGRDPSSNELPSVSGRWPLGSITPVPAVADFEWVNKGTGVNEATTSELYTGLSMVRDGDGSGASALVRTLPGASYIVTALVSANVLPRSWMGAGLCWRESSSGKLVIFGQFGEAAREYGLALKKYTNATTWSADYIWEKFPRTPYLFLRLEKSGTNRIASFSFDGHNFIPYHTVSNSDFMTPDQVGIFVEPQQQSTPKFDMSLSVLSWEEIDTGI